MVSEVNTLLEKKETFTYRVVNDDLKVSVHVVRSLVSALYPEELLEKNMYQIRKTPKTLTKGHFALFNRPKVKIAAALALVVVAAGLYIYKKK